jgi:hypothetical protein
MQHGVYCMPPTLPGAGHQGRRRPTFRQSRASARDVCGLLDGTGSISEVISSAYLTTGDIVGHLYWLASVFWVSLVLLKSISLVWVNVVPSPPHPSRTVLLPAHMLAPFPLRLLRMIRTPPGAARKGTKSLKESSSRVAPGASVVHPKYHFYC